jgi:signal transduction histidine kinase
VAGSERVLRHVAETLNATTDAEAAIAAILPHLSEALGLRTAWVFRYDPVLRQFREVAAAALPPALAAGGGEPLRQGSCECQRRFLKGELLHAVNIVTCSRLRDAVGDRQGLERHASVALVTGERALGILNVAAPGRHRFSQRALAMAEAVAGQVSVAIDRSDLLRARELRIARLREASEGGHRMLEAEGEDELWSTAVREAARVTEAPFAALVRAGEVVARWEGEFRAHPRARPSRAGGLPDQGTWSVHGPAVRLGARSGAFCAVGGGLGHLVVESDRPGRFDAVDIEALSHLATALRLAVATQRERREGQTRAMEGERRRIARELHDAVSQKLFSAALSLASARSLLAGAPPEAAAALARTAAALTSAQDEMRALVRTLEPRPYGGLRRELADLVHSLAGARPTRLVLRLPREEPALALPAREALYRIASEALHNALRHARAGTVEVRLRRSRPSSSWILTVADDGVGLPPEGYRGAGLGLASMAERARDAGGRLLIRRRPGGGTVVRVEVPARAGGQGRGS